MCHDYCHCLDFKDDCPKDCFRAELERDLQSRKDMVGVPLTYAHLEGTSECAKCKPKVSRWQTAKTDDDIRLMLRDYIDMCHGRHCVDCAYHRIGHAQWCLANYLTDKVDG